MRQKPTGLIRERMSVGLAAALAGGAMGPGSGQAARYHREQSGAEMGRLYDISQPPVNLRPVHRTGPATNRVGDAD